MAVGTLKLGKTTPVSSVSVGHRSPATAGRQGILWYQEEKICPRLFQVSMRSECPGLDCVDHALVSWDVTAEWEAEGPWLQSLRQQMLSRGQRDKGPLTLGHRAPQAPASSGPKGTLALELSDIAGPLPDGP